MLETVFPGTLQFATTTKIYDRERPQLCGVFLKITSFLFFCHIFKTFPKKFVASYIGLLDFSKSNVSWLTSHHDVGRGSVEMGSCYGDGVGSVFVLRLRAGATHRPTDHHYVSLARMQERQNADDRRIGRFLQSTAQWSSGHAPISGGTVSVNLGDPDMALTVRFVYCSHVAYEL